MAITTIVSNSKKIENLIKESVKKAMALEFMKLRADLISFVSDKEQREIEKLYNKPARKIAKSIKVRL